MNTPDNTYWNTRDGRRILVADMEDEHVINSVKMLTRQLGCSTMYSCSDKQRLCDLIAEKQLQATLLALLDPNIHISI